MGLVEEREAKLAALRETLNASVEQGGAHSADDVRAHLAAVAGDLSTPGH